MGADLYWEEKSFHPKPNKAEWKKNTLVVYRNVFYHGYQEWFRVPEKDLENKTIQTILKKVVGRIPKKPESNM